MKIYEKKEQRKKSWSVTLVKYDDGTLALAAVGTDTGKWITNILTIDKGIRIQSGVVSDLEAAGYDPFEHHTLFKKTDGSIVTE